MTRLFSISFRLPVKIRFALLLSCFLFCGYHAFGHAGGPPVPGERWVAWNWDLIILFNLGLAASLYARGLYRLWDKAGRGRGVSVTKAVAFGMALVSLFGALISPLDALSAQLSSAHMLQHMIIMNVAAPLAVIGAPVFVAAWALPLQQRRIIGSWLFHQKAKTAFPRYLFWHPLLLWSLYAFTLWIWHLPTLYQAALRHPLIHDFQHLTFFLASCLFWRVLLDPISRFRLNRLAGVLYLFTTSLHAAVLGVFMAFAMGAWYGDYEATTGAWSLSALEDQQLAGLIMWMPGCMIYAGVAALIFGLWLRDSDDSPWERRSPLREA